MKKKILSILITILAVCTLMLTMTACTNKVEFKINFFVDNEIYATIDTSGAEKIQMPEKPTKEDYIFCGWFWDKDVWEKPFKAKSLLDAPLSSDISVYARFAPEEIMANFNFTLTSTTFSITGIIDKTITEIIVPDCVTSISQGAFDGCDSLTSIEIPDSVTSIGDDAFYDCSSLSKVNYTGTIDQWVQIEFDNYDSNPSCYAKNLYINDVLVTEANITTATKINSYAFSGCSSIYSIVIPDSVTYIGSCAFYGCDSLTSIEIPDSVTVIGVGVFSGCSSIFSIVIPDSVTTIGPYAFDGCTSLTSVVIGDSVERIGNEAFRGCTSLTSIVIPDSVTRIGRSAFSGCSSLTSVTFKDTSTWYITAIIIDWQNNTGGTKTSVTNSSTNATYFKSTYCGYYWYKL